jgi:2,3-bisphosphoglycerate-independent phosphoglycerate mutase
MRKPLVLLVMDGFGLSSETLGNAILAAHTPFLDEAFAKGAFTRLSASGTDVGLPPGQMGNSEVGHTNIGAGRVVYQDLSRITKTIEEGKLSQNPALRAAMRRCMREGHALHLMGLVSDGGVHSHNSHLLALLQMARDLQVEKVYVHCFLDGRDVPPMSGLGYIKELNLAMTQLCLGKIATVCGRYYAMDRDRRWGRVQKAYEALTTRKGGFFATAEEAVRTAYSDGITDEFVPPCVIDGGKEISPGDSVIFFNFRPDRARQLTRAFADGDFDGFPRPGGRIPTFFVTMTEYDSTIPNVHIAFESDSLRNTLGEVLARAGKSQLRLAETEKYAHVTFFFNGGREEPYPGENRILVPSPKIPTYDLQPEMSAPEVAQKAVEAIEGSQYDVIVMNFANCDMVGHTGKFDAAVQAVRAVDAGAAAVAEAVERAGGLLILTADHGNAERLLDEDGHAVTAHTTNPVPFVLLGKNFSLREHGALCDIAPTMLDLLQLPQPREMTGRSLLKKTDSPSA